MNPLYLFGREMTPLRKLLLMKVAAGGVPINEYTTTGNPMSFDTNVSKPLKSLVIPWTPTQSGTGDPSPENVRPISGVSAVNVWRTGKNLFDVAHATILDGYLGGTTGNYTFTESATSKTFVIPCKGNTHYTVTRKNAESRFSVGTTKELHTSGEFSIVDFRNYNNTGNSTKEVHITTSESVNYMYVWYYRSASDSDYDATIEEMMVEIGDTPSTYSPYTGETVSVAFPALGKNLFDSEIEQGSFAPATGEPSVSETRIRTKDFISIGEGTYTISNNQNYNVVIYTYDSNKNVINSESRKEWQTSPCTFTVTNGKYIKFAWKNSSGTTIIPSDISEVQFELGSSVTAYEPYTSTVYGGSLDLTTGVLTIDRKLLTLTGENSWSVSGTSKFYVSINTLVDESYRETTTNNTQYSNLYLFQKISADGSSAVTTDKRFYLQRLRTGYEATWNRVWVYDSAYTLAEFKEMINTTPLQVTYPIVEQTWQLTPQEITTLANQTNVIWSDTNGSNTAVYLKKG